MCGSTYDTNSTVRLHINQYYLALMRYQCGGNVHRFASNEHATHPLIHVKNMLHYQLRKSKYQKIIYIYIYICIYEKIYIYVYMY